MTKQSVFSLWHRGSPLHRLYSDFYSITLDRLRLQHSPRKPHESQVSESPFSFLPRLISCLQWLIETTGLQIWLPMLHTISFHVHVTDPVSAPSNKLTIRPPGPQLWRRMTGRKHDDVIFLSSEALFRIVWILVSKNYLNYMTWNWLLTTKIQSVEGQLSSTLTSVRFLRHDYRYWCWSS